MDCLGSLTQQLMDLAISPGVRWVMSHSIRPFNEKNMDLNTAQLLTADLFYSLCIDRTSDFANRLLIGKKFSNLDSSYLGVWLRDDFSFEESDVKKSLNVLAGLVVEQVLAFSSPLLATFLGLESKYELRGYFNQYLVSWAQQKENERHRITEKKTQTQPTPSISSQSTSSIYSRLTSSIFSRPPSPVSSQPRSPISFRPRSPISSRPRSPISSQPRSPISSQPTSLTSSQPTSLISSQPMTSTLSVQEHPSTGISTDPMHSTAVNQTEPTPIMSSQLASSTSRNHTQPTTSSQPVPSTSRGKSPLPPSVSSQSIPPSSRRLDKQLWEGVNKGNLQAVREALKAGANPDSCDSDEWTPLHSAARNGYYHLLLLLLSTGANINKKCRHNWFTPLHEAAVWGKTDCARLLLECGANANVRDKKGYTPLMYAKYRKYHLLAKVIKFHSNHRRTILRVQ